MLIAKVIFTKEQEYCWKNTCGVEAYNLGLKDDMYLGWPKSLFEVLWKNLNKLYGQPYTLSRERNG